MMVKLAHSSGRSICIYNASFAHEQSQASQADIEGGVAREI